MNRRHALARSALVLLVAGTVLPGLSTGPALAGSAVAGRLVTGSPAATEDPSPEPTTASTTWALRPATADGPDGRISLRNTIDPGGTASDLVALTNFGERPAQFAVYASDGTISAKGSFDLLRSDQAPVDGGSWITLGPVEGATARDGGGLVLDVPAASSVVVPVQIAVPADATPGDHAAGVVAELLGSDASGLQVATRVGVRVHLRVSGDVVPALAVEGVSTGYAPSWNPFAPGEVTVRYTITNAGNVRLGAETQTGIAGPFDIGREVVSSEVREMLPGSASTAVATASMWPLFLARGQVVVDPVVVGDDVVETPPDAVRVEFSAWTVPWAQLVLVLLVVGGVVLARRGRARSRAAVQARIDAAVAAATAAQAGSTQTGSTQTVSIESPAVAEATASAEASDPRGP